MIPTEALQFFSRGKCSGDVLVPSVLGSWHFPSPVCAQSLLAGPFQPDILELVTSSNCLNTASCAERCCGLAITMERPDSLLNCCFASIPTLSKAHVSALILNEKMNEWVSDESFCWESTPCCCASDSRPFPEFQVPLLWPGSIC